MGCGSEIITYDRYTDDREALGAALAAERDLTFVPPYDHEHVIAGQGTSALELLEDTGPLGALVVPVGGGLIAGSATAATSLHHGIRVIGVEPEAGDDTRRSLEAGHRIAVPVPRTIADGQAASEAMHLAMTRLKIVVEPCGATGLAALLRGRGRRPPRRIGVIVSGGNLEL